MYCTSVITSYSFHNILVTRNSTGFVSAYLDGSYDCGGQSSYSIGNTGGVIIGRGPRATDNYNGNTKRKKEKKRKNLSRVESVMS